MHAGLECGIIQGLYPDMDMISIGPDLQFPHSPDERVHIHSVAKVWEFIKVILEHL
jgi:dipeptidase D